jgi:hypothetical protein
MFISIETNFLYGSKEQFISPNFFFARSRNNGNPVKQIQTAISVRDKGKYFQQESKPVVQLENESYEEN